MAFDPHANFSYSTILTAPTPAASGTSIVVQAGDGAKFPAASFNATIWPAGQQPTTANAEIVRVTVIAVDTFTITRTQEGTNARTIVAGDQIAATITKKTITDIEAAIPTILTVPSGGTGAATFTAHGVMLGNGASALNVTAAGTTGQVLTGVTGADPVWAAAAAQVWSLLKATTGTDTAAGATTVDSVATGALTAKDTLYVIVAVEEVTQPVTRLDLYSVTDATNICRLSLGGAIGAGVSGFMIATITQAQSSAAKYLSHVAGATTGGSVSETANNVLATNWTTGFTLGLRHGGVTAGGTLGYNWKVFKVAGQ